jgi:hypothetical protein
MVNPTTGSQIAGDLRGTPLGLGKNRVRIGGNMNLGVVWMSCSKIRIHTSIFSTLSIDLPSIVRHREFEPYLTFLYKLMRPFTRS